MEPAISFLEQVAQTVWQEQKHNLFSTSVILPTQRASFFFRKAWSKLNGGGGLLPQIYTLDSFVEQHSGMRIADALDLQVILYDEVYQKLGDSRESATYLPLSQVLLNDFNTLDHALVNAKDFFSYLDKTKALATWSPGQEELSDLQEQYLEFWNRLADVYHGFRARLQARGEAYPGMAYRHFAEHFPNNWSEVVYLAGFNALQPTEAAILDHLELIGKGNALWDADAFYLNAEEHEAGRTMRERRDKAKSNRKPFRWETNLWPSGPPTQMETFGLNGEVAQVRQALSLVNAAPPLGGFRSVVLANEQLLPKLLAEWPENLPLPNVTMGFPLTSTQTWQMSKAYIDLCFSLSLEQNQVWASLSAWQNFRKAPGWRLLGWPKGERSYARKVSIAATPLPSGLSPETFSKPEGVNWLRQLQAIVDHGPVSAHLKAVPLEKAAGQRLSNALSRLINFFENRAELIRRLHIDEIRSLSEQVLQNQSMRLEGESPEGWQVMGMLETRVLRFDHMVLVGASEGHLPAGGREQSLFPADVRQAFSLPGRSQTEAVFAYHFIRLLQRSTLSQVIFRTGADEKGTYEPSRFLRQIWAPEGVPNTWRFPILPLSPSRFLASAPAKTPEVLELLRENLKTKKLSHSRLKYLMMCELRFLLEWGLSPIDHDEEKSELGKAELGIMVHEALAEYLVPLKNKEALPKPWPPTEHEVLKALAHVAMKRFPNIDMGSGSNLLLLQGQTRILHSAIGQITRNLGTKWEVHDLEAYAESEFSLKDGTTIKLKGTIDRIDWNGSNWRILDYKTGKVEPKNMIAASWDELNLRQAKHEYLLQLGIYGWLWTRKKNQPLELALLPLMKKTANPLPLKVNGENLFGPEAFEPVERKVAGWLEDLLDPDKEITLAPDPKSCTYCPFKVACDRE
jgi:hypothetical protein